MGSDWELTVSKGMGTLVLQLQGTEFWNNWNWLGRPQAADEAF